jgi:hypothetical protein
MFTIPKINVVAGDEGFSVEVLGRTGIEYREGGNAAFVDSEVLVTRNGMLRAIPGGSFIFFCVCGSQFCGPLRAQSSDVTLFGLVEDRVIDFQGGARRFLSAAGLVPPTTVKVALRVITNRESEEPRSRR